MAAHKQFNEAVQRLWDEHVRTELIYGKKLMFCRSCLAFYYGSDSKADHPPQDREEVHSFFGGAGITSIQRLANFLWALHGKTLTNVPALFENMVTSKHHIKAKPDSVMGSQSHATSLEARIQSVETQLARESRRVEEMKEENRVLTEDNEEILRELIKTRSELTQSLAKIRQLAMEITGLAHPLDCKCGQPELHRPPVQNTSN